MKRYLLTAFTHALFFVAGFAGGIYVLPLLTAPEGPRLEELESLAASAVFTTRFRRDLAGSDLLHWGEGVVSVGSTSVSLMGRVAPGPDYKLYLSPQFVENEEQFLAVRHRSVRLGDVNTFENFAVPVPPGVDISRFTTVVVWCEAFSRFITAAAYR